MSTIDEQNASMKLHATCIQGTVKIPTQGITRNDKYRCRRNAYSINWGQQLRLQTAWVAHDRHHMKSPVAYWQQRQVNETLLAQHSEHRKNTQMKTIACGLYKERENAQLNTNDDCTCLWSERMLMCIHTSLACTPTNGSKTQMTSSNMATACRHTLHSLGSQKESIFIEGGQIHEDNAKGTMHQQWKWSSKRPREHPCDRPGKCQT